MSVSSSVVLIFQEDMRWWLEEEKSSILPSQVVLQSKFVRNYNCISFIMRLLLLIFRVFFFSRNKQTWHFNRLSSSFFETFYPASVKFDCDLHLKSGIFNNRKIKCNGLCSLVSFRARQKHRSLTENNKWTIYMNSPICVDTGGRIFTTAWFCVRTPNH